MSPTDTSIDLPRKIRAEPLTARAFRPYGQVIEARGQPDRIINAGMCGRFHDLLDMDIQDGRPGLSIFRAVPRRFPYYLDLIERHPLGSQCFVPMTQHPFLVTVAIEGRVRAFVTEAGQAVNIGRGVWHGVLTPLHSPGLFAVIDRIGDGENLVERKLDPPMIVEAPE